MKNPSALQILLLILFMAVSLPGFALNPEQLNLGAHFSWGGQNLLIGGPVVGIGTGWILDYRLTGMRGLLLNTGLTLFFSPEQALADTVSLHFHLDAAYPLIALKHFEFSIGAGFIYDIVKSDTYNVCELSVEMLTRIALPRERYCPFLQAKLELGGFDTYIISAGATFPLGRPAPEQ